MVVTDVLFSCSDKFEFLQPFDWKEQNEKTNIASYNSYIKFAGKSLNLIRVLEIYDGIKDEMMRNNVSVCNSVLSCMVKNGKFESSLKMFHQMKRYGLNPNTVTYSMAVHSTDSDLQGKTDGPSSDVMSVYVDETFSCADETSGGEDSLLDHCGIFTNF